MLKKLLIIGLATAALAFAQRGGGGGGDMGGDMGGGGGGGSRGGGMGGDMGGGGFGQAHVNHLDQWTKDLKLNKDQKKSIKAIMDEGQKTATPLNEQLEKAREAAAEAAAAAKSDADFKAAVKKCADVQAQIFNLELASFVKIYKELDNDQQPKSAAIYTAMNGIFKTKNWNE
jgi:Spy/CpxP family protein refolding chaperone